MLNAKMASWYKGSMLILPLLHIVINTMKLLLQFCFEVCAECPVFLAFRFNYLCIHFVGPRNLLFHHLISCSDN